ncbi:MAG: LPS export ABC transporter periplasmic protein LptC, partial [Shewanella sp.]
MSRVTLAIIAFFGTALILYWQVQQKRSTDTGTGLNDQNTPDYIVDDLRSIEFNEQGQVNSRVSAKHMEHYELKNQTHFTEP